MRLTLLAAAIAMLAAGACDEGHNPPLNSGTGTGTGSGGDGDGDGDGDADAGPTADADPNAVTVTGTVCLVTDMRFPLDCLSADMSGVVVRELGTTNSVTAAANGAFSIAVTAGTLVYLEAGVGASTLRQTIVPVALGASGATGAGVPVIDLSYWSSLVNQTAGAEADETGAFAVYLTEDGEAAVGAEVFAPDSPTSPYYDNGGRFNWTQVGLSGSEGTALVFNMPTDADEKSVSAVNSTGTAFRSTNAPIRALVTTFIGVDLTD